jgi:hypothetical protein
LLGGVALLPALVAGPAVAQPASPEPQSDVVLEALGGATLKAPAKWKDVKKEPALVVREQAPPPADKTPVLVLLAALEDGPTTAPGADIPWTKVRDNIVAAAKRDGRTVSLVVGDEVKDVAGFEGRRLQGELEAAPAAGSPPGTAARKVVIQLVALVKNQRLLTIGLLAEPASELLAREQVLAIAKTARLGP